MFEMLLGHLVGDYLFQNEYMASTKGKNSWMGWLMAFTHCLLYTFAVCLIMWNFDFIWIVAVFFSHFFIDKFMLAERYRKLIGGSTLKGFLYKNDWVNNLIYMPKPDIEVNRKDILDGGFASLVYTLTDNTMHLLLMWGAYKIIY